MRMSITFNTTTPEFLNPTYPSITPRRIVIVGAGVVGTATGNAMLGLGHEVHFVDTNPATVCRLLNEGKQASVKMLPPEGDSIVLVCVPTPSNGTGFDLTLLTAAVSSIGHSIARGSGSHIVAIRSTVSPGTTDRLVAGLLRSELDRSTAQVVVASTPEFLREASAALDAVCPTVTVIGSRSAYAREELQALFLPLGGDVRIFDTTTASELVKIVHNCFNATKISFFNEVHKIADLFGIDGDTIGEVVVRSAEASTNPDYGIRGGFAFGGHCLPKDLDGMIGFATAAGLATPLLEAVRTVNQSFTTVEVHA